MVRIKICGVTNIDDALSAEKCGADVIGFVFAPSKRKISPGTVREIIRELPPFVQTAGVFWDADVEEVNRVVEFTGLDMVQLHGSESPEYCRKINTKVIKRFPVLKNDTAEALDLRMEKYQVSAYLLDPGAGSGEIFDWKIAKGIDRPLIIAGGLTPENVREVIGLLDPYGVDVSSGVEKALGRKDREKVKKFILEARKCL